MSVPRTRTDDDVVEEYFGTLVADPYRWLEDDRSAETAEWVSAQNVATREVLDAIGARPAIVSRLSTLWDRERFGVPFFEGGRWFWFHNTGLQNQDILFCASEPFGDDARVVLDPNGFSDDGTVSLAGIAPSPDGRCLAYGRSTAGSDWTEWRVRDIETGDDLPDRLEWVKFSGASWLPDGSGIFYSAYEPPAEGDELTATNLDQRLHLHRLGEHQSDDALIHSDPTQPEWGFMGSVADEGHLLTVSVWHGTSPKNGLLYQRLVDSEPVGPMVELLLDFDAAYSLIGALGDQLYLWTDLDAPKGRVVMIDLARPERTAWTELIPEGDDTLSWVVLMAEHLLCGWLVDATSKVTRHALDGTQLDEIALPGVGTAAGFGGLQSESESYWMFTGFTDPGSIHHLDILTGETREIIAPEVAFDGSGFETTQVFAESPDETLVPIFVVHRSDIVLDGSNPTILYGYGGFNISMVPAYSTSVAAWLEMGGVYASAVLRGGGEYGEEWHEAGTGLAKQHVFDDFIAAAEHLVAEGWTRPDRLAIQGGSNGGLLVGATMCQRPELFAAAVPHVGVMDMLRYHRFTIGWAWASDYGTSEDSAEMFEYLHGYSPLHQLTDGTHYPATLVFTGDHDDRVVPAHSFKFAARLQAAQGGDAPTLIRIETSAGHGAGTPTDKLIEASADELAFLADVLEMSAPDPS